jgi:hypothetical protein
MGEGYPGYASCGLCSISRLNKEKDLFGQLNNTNSLYDKTL